MDEGQREAPTSVLAVVAGLLVGLGLGAVGVLAWADQRDEDPAPVAGRPTSQVAGSTSGTTDATAAERCASAAATLRAPLAAAEPALEQWEVHIEAMNRLVVGEITLPQATAFWERTRVGAQQRVDRFDAAWAGARRAGVDCPSPLLLAPADEALRPCARQVVAEMRALAAARTSLGMWAQHIKHMDLLRLGDLSPARATSMWLSMWKRGDRQLEDYRTAEQEHRGLDGCTSGGSSTSAAGPGRGHQH